MLVALSLGLMGSLGHCVGMCSGITLLLSRRGTASGWRLLLIHLGRTVTYGLLGLTAGALGRTVELALPGVRQWQGALALTAAGTAIYLALALVGWVPSPEIYFAGLTRRWGRVFQRLTAASGQQSAIMLSLAWGLLPCGLVLTALLPAAVTGSPWRGALTMLAFGIGTWPALLGVGWMARQGFPRALPWSRQIAALVVLLFGTQMAMRGLAAWGWVSHLHVGSVMIW